MKWRARDALRESRGRDTGGAGGIVPRRRPGWRGSFVPLLGAVLLAAGVSLAGCTSAPPPDEEERPSASDSATSAYYVRLAPDVDPRAVASEHRLTPDTVIVTERARAFQGTFTGAEAERLRQDERVRSVSIRVEGEGWTPRDPMGLPEDTSNDGSG